MVLFMVDIMTFLVKYDVFLTAKSIGEHDNTRLFFAYGDINHKHVRSFSLYIAIAAMRC